ncbi:MAG: hypothetical protein ABIR38_02625, partial [Chthoniobacterales bacterium]
GYRVDFGNAGRARIEQSFQVETTIEPLLQRFRILDGARSEPVPTPTAPADRATIAYLVDCFPATAVAGLEFELQELRKRHLDCAVYVCRFQEGQPLSAGAERAALQFDFLPDAMAIEAEWQANPALGYALEDDRANQKHRASADIFLAQARYAVALRSLLKPRGIRHVHATSSSALLAAIMLKKLLPVTVSATIEPEPTLPVRVLRNALAECVGGRVSDPGLKTHLGSEFLLESTKLFRSVRLHMSGQSKLLNAWCDLLQTWR